MVCASSPATIVQAIQNAGYKAEMGKSDQGNPMIISGSSGTKWVLFFYDCEQNKQCASVQFSVSFKADDRHTADLANKWNSKKRVGQMAVLDDKSLAMRYDLSTIGGLNQINFKDDVDWWVSTVDEMNKFFDAELK